MTTKQAVQTLTRNQSAYLVQKMWSTMVEQSPESTEQIRTMGAAHYIACAGVVDNLGSMHEDHRRWLETMLDDKDVLDLADQFAAAARKAADPTRPTMIVSGNGKDAILAPVFWRD